MKQPLILSFMGSNGPSWGRRHVAQTIARDEWLKAKRDADAKAVRYWNIRLEQGEPLRPSPTLGQAINGGYTHLRCRCDGCKNRRLVALADIKRKPDTRLWTLEGSLACQSCSQGGFRPKAKLERVTRSVRDIGWADP